MKKRLKSKMPKRRTMAPSALKRMSHDDLPATVGLVKEMRAEILSEMRAMEHRLNARFEAVDARFETQDARFEAIDSRFEAIDSRFEAIDSRFESQDARFEAIDARFERVDARFDTLEAITHRTLMIVEEMRGENRIVLDAIKNVIERQDRQEFETAELRKAFHSLYRT